METFLQLKIGIVLNYKKAEQKKDELYCINQFPWLALAAQKEYSKYCIRKGDKLCVPADVAIGLYLETLSNIIVIIFHNHIGLKFSTRNIHFHINVIINCIIKKSQGSSNKVVKPKWFISRIYL